MFVTSKFSYLLLLFFPIPPIKLKVRLLRATHLDQSNYLANQQQVSGFVLPFYQPLRLVEKCWAKTIVQSQTGMFWLFFIQFSLAWPRIKYCEAVLNLGILLHSVFFFCIPLLLLLPLMKAFCYIPFFSFFLLLPPFCFLPLPFDLFIFCLKCNEVAEVIIGKENTLLIVDHNNTIIH